MAVNNLKLAINLAIKRSKKTRQAVEVWQNLRKSRKFYVVLPGSGERPPKTSRPMGVFTYKPKEAA